MSLLQFLSLSRNIFRRNCIEISQGLSILLYQSLNLSGILISLLDLVFLPVVSVLVVGTVGLSDWVQFVPVVGLVGGDSML